MGRGACDRGEDWPFLGLGVKRPTNGPGNIGGPDSPGSESCPFPFPTQVAMREVAELSVQEHGRGTSELPERPQLQLRSPLRVLLGQREAYGSRSRAVLDKEGEEGWV